MVWRRILALTSLTVVLSLDGQFPRSQVLSRHIGLVIPGFLLSESSLSRSVDDWEWGLGWWRFCGKGARMR